MGFEIVVVGSSTGGLGALQTLLSGLPYGFSVPLVLVQHRGKDSEIGLCEFLGRSTSLPVKEPEDKEIMLPGHVYLAPRDYHLLLDGGSFALSIEPPVACARPSINVLFESAAEAYRERAIGVIMTGANHDGAIGLAKIKALGGVTVIQDPTSATSAQMPEAALARSRPDWVLPLHQIAPCLQKLSNPAALAETARGGTPGDGLAL